SHTPEAVRPVSRESGKSSSEVRSRTALKESVQTIVGEITKARANSPEAAKQLEQSEVQASQPEGSSSHQTLQELAKGNVSRITKIDRFIYAEVLRAHGDVAKATQALQESVRNGSLYNVEENLIYNKQRLEKVCTATGIDYQIVQQKAQEYGISLAESNLSPDQVLALEVLAFRDLLVTQLGHSEYVTNAYESMHGRMTNSKTQERYKELTGKDLTIDNIIGATPKNVKNESEKTKVDNKEKSLGEEIEEMYRDFHIKIDGKEISFEELASFPDSKLAEGILAALAGEEDPVYALRTRLNTIQELKQRGFALATDAKKQTNLGAYAKALEQQVRLEKLNRAHLEALVQKESTKNESVQQAA
ncbi:MAG: hypothetical protein KGL95_03775, partial [Patescibacteria group bacterium]|nr:hypothetical protein [Patescibacteria group bacterium]